MKKKRTKKRLTDELSVRRFLIKMKLPLFLLMILFQGKYNSGKFPRTIITR